jgi:hypothetical protein
MLHVASGALETYQTCAGFVALCFLGLYAIEFRISNVLGRPSIHHHKPRVNQRLIKLGPVRAHIPARNNSAPAWLRFGIHP